VRAVAAGSDLKRGLELGQALPEKLSPDMANGRSYTGTAHVITAHLNTTALDTPTARISPLPADTTTLILDLRVDVSHPLLPAAKISCWHHAKALRHVVITATPTVSAGYTAAERAAAEGVLEQRNYWRYQPLLGILHLPLSSLSLSSEGKVKVTLVGFETLPHAVLGFTAPVEIQSAVPARARVFGNLDVVCVRREEWEGLRPVAG